MNFAISRAELTALTGIKRTQTFALQKTGQIQVLSQSLGKGWFDLEQILNCAAVLRGLPLPDANCVQKHAQLVLEARLTRMVKPQKSCGKTN